MRKVVVTTKHRGVFFGTLEGSESQSEIVLTDARNCIYWTKATGGFMGLASRGPASGSRLGASVARVRLYDITAIMDCTDVAAKRWTADD